jgi:hypothetical protein
MSPVEMWSPSEAAEFRVASAMIFLREIASDRQALRGAHRLLSIAQSRGGDVTLAGVKFSGLQQELRSRSRSRARSKTCTPNGDGTNVTAVAGGENSRNRFRHSPSAAAGAAPTPNPQTGSSLRSRARSLPGPTQARPTEPNKWMAPKPKRFGIKKAWQKMRAASRVGAGLQRWLSRGRAALQAAALARSRAPAEIVATPPPSPSPKPSFSRRHARRFTGRYR